MITWKIYAALGLLVTFLAVGGFALYERQVAIAATAKVDVANARTKEVTGQRDDALTKLAQDEVDKADLVKQRDDLDIIVVAQQQRQKELENEKAQVWEQFDKLVKSQPKEDQDCAARALPDSTLEWLRDDRPADSHQVPKGPDTAKPAPVVH